MCKDCSKCENKGKLVLRIQNYDGSFRNKTIKCDFCK